MRVPRAEKARWQKAALANGMDLASWIRAVCGENADRLFPRSHTLMKVTPPTRDCPRWMYHVVGVYCPGCDTVIPG